MSSLLKFNIERAIQSTFNIKKTHNFVDTAGVPKTLVPDVLVPDVIVPDAFEISGIAVASQEAQELNNILFKEGHLTGQYYFSPNGKWSVLYMNKIKIQWAERCKQTKDQNGKIWNIVPGSWQKDVFLPDLQAHAHAHKVRVEIHPTVSQTPDTGTLNILIPHHIYKLQTDISNLVPQVRFDKKQLECVNPKSIANVSINRQGIYVNRKYRDKVDLVDLSDKKYTKVDHYRLNIYYNNQLIDSYEL